MLAVVQRVSRAEVRIAEHDYAASIGAGLVILLGIEQGDTEQSADWLAKKCAHLRIFADEEGKMNRSVSDINGQILAISQFTLAGDCRKGNRPSFVNAGHPDVAEPLYEHFVEQLHHIHGIETMTGMFQTHMDVELVNDGPVTIQLQHPI